MDPEVLKTIEDLELEMQSLTGDERTRLRRKIRRLKKKGSGVSMTRVTGTRTRTRKVTARVEDESEEDQHERFRDGFEDLDELVPGLKLPDDMVYYPAGFLVSIVRKKFVADRGKDPEVFVFVPNPATGRHLVGLA